MGFGDFIKSLFSSVEVQQENDPARRSVRIGGNTYTPVQAKEYMNRLAWYICKDYIASAVSKVEMRTFLRGREVFGEEYYRWNYKPNVNQTSTEFWIEAVNKYYENGELLIIPIDRQLIIADSWNREEYTLKPAVYKNVVCKTLTFDRWFTGDEVMYFRTPDGLTLRPMIAGVADLIDGTLSEAADKYRLEGGERGTLTIDSMQTGSNDDNDELEEILNEDFEAYFQSKNAVVPLFEGMEYKPVTNPNGQKTSIVNDIQSLLHQSIEVVAQAVKIPPVLIIGNVADSKTAVQNFLSFCIDPFMNMIAEGANACLYGQNVLKGSCISPDSSCIEHADIFSLAEKVDKLIAASVLNVNEVRRKVGEPQIPEDWANEYTRTKNYEAVNAAGKDDNNADNSNDTGENQPNENNDENGNGGADEG